MIQGTRLHHKEEDGSIFRIPPYYYLHVFDQTTNVTKVEIGPKTFIRQDNEKVTFDHSTVLNVFCRFFEL